MQIVILAYGTRGDIQPLLALGVSLARAGHAVRFAAPHPFASFVSAWGLEFAPLPGDPAVLSRRLADFARGNPVRVIRSIYDYGMGVGAEMWSTLEQACRGADLILHAFLMTVAGNTFACSQGIPQVSAQVFPTFAATRSFPALMFPRLGWGAYHRWTYHFYNQVFWQTNRLGFQTLVRRGLVKAGTLLHNPFSNRDSPPLLFGFSPRVIAPPSDWGPNVHVTGYWFLEEPGWQPPAELLQFLEAGPAPVCVGFGSMISSDMLRIEQAVVEALQRTGKRAILLGGWGGLGSSRLPDGVLCLDSVPHTWLLPRVEAFVHHGGAGTTAAVLRAGIPSLAIPFTADQFFWAERLRSLGVSPARVLRRHQVSPRSLAEAVTACCEDPALGQSAADLGRQIRSEDGLARAVALIEQAAA